MHDSGSLTVVQDRSTKAGARTPATLPVPIGLENPEHRSTKAGARTPAIRSWRPASAAFSTSLNEGRGANPGDTRRPPASGRRGAPLNEGGGANPGDTNRGWQALVVVHRSTKAGARTPATPATVARPAAPVTSAQRRPGREPRRHAYWPSMAPVHNACAQRRPGREPRRHSIRPVIPGFSADAQRRPGREPRRHMQR